MELVTMVALVTLAVIWIITCAICAVVFLMKKHDAKIRRQARIEIYEAYIRDAASRKNDTADIRELNCHHGRYPWGDDKEN